MRISAIRLAQTASAAAILAAGSFGFAPFAGADANNVTVTSGNVGVFNTNTCSSGSVSGASFNVPNAGDYIIVQAGIGYNDSTVVNGHYRVDTLNTPTDTQGNTYSFINGLGVGGASTGHWAGMWMAKAGSAGTDVVTLGCSFAAGVTQAAGSVVGTFTSNGTNHTLSVDTSRAFEWNYWNGGNTSQNDVTPAATTAANDLVVNGGYIREHAWLSSTINITGGEPSLTFSGTSYAGGGTSGTQWSDYNIGTGSSTWASGTTPSDTYNFVRASDGVAYPYSVGGSVIAALIAN